MFDTYLKRSMIPALLLLASQGMAQSGLTVTPNPFNDRFTLNMGRGVAMQGALFVEITHETSSFNRRINTTPDQTTMKVDASGFPEGRYVINVFRVSDGQHLTRVYADKANIHGMSAPAPTVDGGDRSSTYGNRMDGGKDLGINPNPFRSETRVEFGRSLRMYEQVTVTFTHMASGSVAGSYTRIPSTPLRVDASDFPGGRYMVEVHALDGTLLASAMAARTGDPVANELDKGSPEHTGDTRALFHRGPVHAWPNPFNDRLNVLVEQSVGRERMKLTLRSATNGQVVLTAEVNPRNAIVIQTSQVPEGHYLLEVHDASTNEHVGTLQLRK